MTALMP